MSYLRNRQLTAPKMTIASMLLASLTGGLAQANEHSGYIYRMNVQGGVKIPAWATVDTLYGNWSNVGAPYDCAEWTPGTATIDWGEAFQQSRACAQDQQRDATPVLFNIKLNVTKNGPTTQESRVVSVTQFQPNIGNRDYIDTERPDPWGAWLDDGPHYACGPWSPTPDSVDLFDPFTQERNCSQDQQRSRDVFHVWASGNETPKRTDTEARTISETENQPATGSRDVIDGERIGNWEAWADDGGLYDCTAWGPDPSTVNLDQDYTQHRVCQQNQASSRQIFDVWRSGKETLNRIEPRAQIIDVAQSRAAVGSRDFNTGKTTAKAWTEWADQGAPYGCAVWSPAVNTVDLDKDYTQTRDCSQQQVRSREIYDIWQSGKETLNRVENDSQVISVEQSQPATGTKDFIAGSRTAAWGEWRDHADPYNCSSWTPAPDTVKLEENYTQNRACDQKQVRSRNIYHVWQSGKETLDTTEDDDQVISVGQSRPAVGTQDYILEGAAGEFAGDWSTWENDNAPYDCSVWSAAVDTVRLGEAFTQHRSCSQGQTRERTVYHVWKSGQKTFKRTDTGNQVISVGQSQPAVGTKDYILEGSAGVAYGDWSAWSNSGAPFDHSAYAPAAAGQTNDFSQSRSYLQPQQRTRTVYHVWKSGNKTVSGTDTDSQNASMSESRTVTVSVDNWRDTHRSGHAAWAPAAGAQTADYQQSRGYTQHRERTWSYQVGSTALHSRTETGSLGDTESRNVSVSWSGWSNDGAQFDLSHWMPTVDSQPLGSTFTQTQAYRQNQVGDYTHKVGGSTIHTAPQSRVVSGVNGRTATGTQDYILEGSAGVAYGEWGEWGNSASAYDHSAWGPASAGQTADYSQSRTFTQPQQRTRTVYDVWKSGKKTAKGTDTDSRTITPSESRNITVSWSGWANDGAQYDLGAWTPTVESQPLGSDFTQTQAYKQRQAGSYTHQAGGSTVHTAPQSRVVSGTNSRPAVGTQDYKLSGDAGTAYGSWSAWSNSGNVYDCSTWSPAPSTVNLDQGFTQTRSCSQKQSHSRTVYDVWKSGNKTVRTTESGQQVISVEQSQAAVGTKDYILAGEAGVDYGEWSAWSKSDRNKNITSWAPAATTQTSDFSQSRTYDQPQQRTRTVYDVWKSGKKTVKTTETDSRTATIPQSRTVDVSVGGWSNTTKSGYGAWSPAAANQTSNYNQSRSYTQHRSRTWTYQTDSMVLHTRSEAGSVGASESRAVVVDWTGWANDGAQYDVSAWSPIPESQPLGSPFTQIQSYKQRQQGAYNHRVGSTEIHSAPQSRVVSGTNSRQAIGSKDYILSGDAGTAYGDWSDWSKSARNRNYGPWFPQPSDQTADFPQTRTYDQPQERTRTVYDVWKSGQQTVRTTETDSRTVTLSQSRVMDVSVSDWSNTTKSGYGAWSPAAAGQTSNYSQSRNYTQHRERTWAYKGSESTTNILYSRSEVDSVGASESRNIAVSWSGWSNDGGQYNLGAWTPTVESQPLGTAFTQTQSYSQKQKGSYSHKAGSTEIHSAPQSRVVSGTNSRPATGTQDYILAGEAGVSYGSWSGWSNSGSASNFSSWGPVAASQTSDFNQSRSYSQPQQRTRTVYDVWKSGKKTVKTTETGSRTATLSQSRTVDVSVGGWSNTTKSGYGAWSPAAASQTSNYNQSRDYTQHRTRTWTYQVGGSAIHSRAEAGSYGSSESRAVTVSWGGWSNDGGQYNLGAWTPATSTVNLGTAFTQTQSYSQKQKGNYSHKVGSTTIHSAPQSRVVSGSNSRSAVGTKDYKLTGSAGTDYGPWSGWSNSGSAYGFTAYAPAASSQTSDFSQSRSYSQPQQRTRTVYDVWASGNKTVRTTETDSRNASLSQSRSVDVSAGGWRNTSTSGFGSWSPAASSQTSDFSQSRSYTQHRERDWTYKVGSSTIHSRTEGGSYGTSQSRTVDVSVSGWSNGSTSGYSSWSPSAGSQTSNYSQSRSYTQHRSRTWTYKAGSTTLHTRGESGSYGTSQSRSVSVSWSGWSTDRTTYEGWTPSTSTVNWGQSFTQTNDYTNEQSGSYTHKVGSSTIHTSSRSRDYSGTLSRSATGTRDYKTGTTNGSLGSWSDNGSAHSYSSWGPGCGTVNWGQSFTQTRSYKQPQIAWYSIYDTWASGKTPTYAGSDYQTRTVTGSQSRSATGCNDYKTGAVSYGSWTGWWDRGGLYSCESWSPSASTVNLGQSFTQTARCRQMRVHSRSVYDVWASGKETFSYTQEGTDWYYAYDSRSATGTKNYQISPSTDTTPWAYHSTSCTSWSPSRSSYFTFQLFYQSRTCTRKDTRTVTTYTNWANGDSQVSSSEVEERFSDSSERQRVYGTKVDTVVRTYNERSHTESTSWSCGSWSPSTGAIDRGVTFTQSRTCSQNYRNVYDKIQVWDSGNETYDGSFYGSWSTRTRNESRTATGTFIDDCGGFDRYGNYEDCR